MFVERYLGTATFIVCCSPQISRRLFFKFVVSAHLEVSINGDTPKWLVSFRENPTKMNDDWGYPYDSGTPPQWLFSTGGKEWPKRFWLHLSKAESCDYRVCVKYLQAQFQRMFIVCFYEKVDLERPYTPYLDACLYTLNTFLGLTDRYWQPTTCSALIDLRETSTINSTNHGISTGVLQFCIYI